MTKNPDLHIIAISLFCLAACAVQTGDSGMTSRDQDASAVVLAVRPVLARNSQADAQAGAVLTALGEEPNLIGPPRTELIVRTGAGETLSVIAARDAIFRPGDRVRIMRGSRTSVAPP